MDIKDILSVGLTAEDFDQLIKGIDAIPEREQWQHVCKDMMLILVAPTAIHREERLKKVGKEMEALKRRQADKNEDFIVLKSKLILLKRLLLSNEAVRMTNDILSTPPQQIRQYIECKRAA